MRKIATARSIFKTKLVVQRNKMKQLLFFFAIFMGYNVLRAQGLRVKFGKDSLNFVNQDFFFDMPLNVTAALELGWVETARPDGHLPELVMYCLPNDVAVCMMYDDIGYVAGLQIAISHEDKTNTILDWSTLGYTNWTTVVDNTTQTFWTIQQYYVSKETLQLPKEDRIASRNPNKILQEDYLWLTGYYGEVYAIPLLIEEYPDFQNQSCVDWMGDHYFNQVTPTTECVSEKLFPWFLVGKSGKIHGVTYWKLGIPEIPTEKRNWFERPAASTVRATAKNGPECLFKLAEETGFIFMHIYFLDDPWNIICQSG